MPEQTAKELTRLLMQASDGDDTAEKEFYETVYTQLSRMAAAHLKTERPDHTLQTAGLVHEVYMRLGPLGARHWDGRQHFYRVATRAMRRILIDHARKRMAAKRGGEKPLEALPDQLAATDGSRFVITDLQSAVDELKKVDSTRAEIAELLTFGGLTLQETADAVGLSLGTLRRKWDVTRAWLQMTMAE